ncbi:MAG: hypothetical protein L6Q76_19375 [Polyangiaceae bacterium]|nr:hypothetical protein [Polyangiaceae bacterium]
MSTSRRHTKLAEGKRVHGGVEPEEATVAAEEAEGPLGPGEPPKPPGRSRRSSRLTSNDGNSGPVNGENGNGENGNGDVVHVAPVSVVPVALTRTTQGVSSDQALWAVIRHSTEAIGYPRYETFMRSVFDGTVDPATLAAALRPAAHMTTQLKPFLGVDPYRLLKISTEIFLMANCGVTKLGDYLTYDPQNPHPPPKNAATAEPWNPSQEPPRLTEADAQNLPDYWNDYLTEIGVGTTTLKTLPYLDLIRNKLSDSILISDTTSPQVTRLSGILAKKLTNPCFMELIWSYWHEEAMLVQTMNAIAMRFQNRRVREGKDPLAQLELDPLRSASSLLWGYVQDEPHRLSVLRRAYEYDHHYGITIIGKSVPPLRTADSRSKFMEAFHNLIRVASQFYKQDDDTTVVADGFPVLNALKEVHLILTQGGHNQYGDLPWNARLEMMMQQWILAQPEIREFLPRRTMVAYPETWMYSVEAMNSLMGWADASVMQFHDLATFGEQILLGVRFGAWTEVKVPINAANWARYWRPEIQGYVHAYRAVTGVDLTASSDATMPSVLLMRRLKSQRANP